MAHFTLTVDPANGPVITAYVTVTPPRQDVEGASEQPVPNGVAVRAVVDTGASCSCVDPTVIAALRLTPTSVISVFTPSTGAEPHFTPQYDVSVVVPAGSADQPPLVISSVPVVSSDLASHGLSALIGRDILRDCILHYNGSTGWFTLAF